MIHEQFPMERVNETIDIDMGVLDALLTEYGVPEHLKPLCYDTEMVRRQETPLVRIGFAEVGVILGVRDG